MIVIIIGLILLGFIVFAIYPAISAPHTSDYMIEEDSPSYMENEEKPVTELVIEKTPTNDDFIEKETLFDEPINYDFKDTVGGRQLTEHIAEVVQLNPNSKKRLNKRERKTVDKIVKEKKKDS